MEEGFEAMEAIRAMENPNYLVNTTSSLQKRTCFKNTRDQTLHSLE
jgi:hypothetical protein